MIHNVDKLEDRLYLVTLNYQDEEIDLIVSRKVYGTEDNALHYVRAFDRDTRVNYRHMFPVPEPEFHEEVEA